MKKRINSFKLEYDFLSNAYPVCIQVDGGEYLNAEAAFQAAGCADREDRHRFREQNPKEARKLARQLPKRPDWDAEKIPEMEKILRAKFTQNPHLARFLLETADAQLIAGNKARDTFWGVDLKTGQGENHLGRLLMALREEFQKNGIPQEAIQTSFRYETGEDGIQVQFRDITRIPCDCIVNAANETLLGGGGVDAAIHRAAGPELLEACRPLGGCKVTQAKITGGYRLPARYVIHTVGPRYGEEDAAGLLERTYQNVLDLAAEYEIHTIAFPAISAGKFGYPKAEAAAIAVESVRRWKQAHPDYGLEVIFADVEITVYRGFCEALNMDKTLRCH